MGWMACEILQREEEDALLVYETDNYEVIRCEILMGDEKVQGCTFRFIGDAILCDSAEYLINTLPSLSSYP